MSEKLIAPEDVEIVSEVKTLYRGSNDTTHWYLNEWSAREHAANANRCIVDGCTNYAKYRYHTTCEECQAKIDAEKHREKLAKAPEWDGNYPVCIDDSFFFDEDALIEYLFENEIDPRSITSLDACSEVRATDAIRESWLLEQVEDEMGEDGECPKEIHELICEFLGKLQAVKTPISWVGDRLVRVTEEQQEYFAKQIAN